MSPQGLAVYVDWGIIKYPCPAHSGKLIGSIDHAHQVGDNVKLRLHTKFGLFCNSDGFFQRVINDGFPIENTSIIHDFVY